MAGEDGVCLRDTDSSTSGIVSSQDYNQHPWFHELANLLLFLCQLLDSDSSTTSIVF